MKRWLTHMDDLGFTITLLVATVFGSVLVLFVIGMLIEEVGDHG